MSDIKMKKIAGNPYLKIENDHIFLDNVSGEEIFNHYDTPILVFLENRIRENVTSFKEVFQRIFENFECFYSFKANYLPEICKIIQSEDVGAEVISLLELKLALKLGFSPNRVIVGGPYLPKDLIEKCVQNSVKEIIVYNLNDIAKINQIAKNLNKTQNICIRVISKKFNTRLGIDFNERNLQELKKEYQTYKNIKITTILSHYSTQMNNIEHFKTNVQSLVQNIRNLKNIGIEIENINLGGGFPEAVIMKKERLIQVVSSIKKIIDDSNLKYKKIYFEPGRYFVGDSGFFIAEIIKTTENRWIFLNLGNNICPKFARNTLRFYNLSKINQAHKFKTSIAGIIPTDQDVLAKNYYFTENLDEGDYVLITNVGAYSLTFSNRFPYSLPIILLLKDRSIKPIFDPSSDMDFSLH